MEFLSGEYIARLLGVLRINLILSGDDALVMAIIRGATRAVAPRRWRDGVDSGAVQGGYVRTVICPIF